MLLHLTEKLESDDGFASTKVNTISKMIEQLKPNLNDSTIILDLPMLFQDPNINVCEIVFMFFTMYRCHQCEPRIVGGVPDNCPSVWISESIKAGVHRLITIGQWADHVENNKILCSDIPIISSKVKASMKLYQREKTEIVLTTRQRQILHLVCLRGLSNKVIGTVLHISESTVKSNISIIMRKYGVRSRTQLVVMYKSTVKI